MTDNPGRKNAVLVERAVRVVPGGMWGHKRASAIGPSYPQFFARSEGCHLWDVDGNEYIDLMCGWGPMILGYHHPSVDDAFRRQLARGDLMNGPAEVMVELAELLVSTIAHADWALFQKNGSDATTNCLTIARAASGRRKILAARGSYHGAQPWSSPYRTGLPEEDRAHIIYFDYNDVASLEQAADRAGKDLAGIIVTPLRHDYARDQELASAQFARRARDLCDDSRAVLILDDVRAGFRISHAGSWEPLGIRPDLSAFSKAIANGYPLAAITGTESLRQSASDIYATGSFWTGAASMAAAVATIRELKATNAIEHMIGMGDKLRSEMEGLSARHGVRLIQTGPVHMPFFRFEDDDDFAKAQSFCGSALRNGVYFHPKHNMFLSLAHDVDAIDRIIHAADIAMREL